MGRLTAMIKEVAGYLTGDRRVEAKGRVEERVADPGDPLSVETDENVHEEELEVRRERGEYGQPGQPRPQD